MNPTTTLATLHAIAAREPHRPTPPISDQQLAAEISAEHAAESRAWWRQHGGSGRDGDWAADVAERRDDRRWSA